LIEDFGLYWGFAKHVLCAFMQPVDSNTASLYVTPVVFAKSSANNRILTSIRKKQGCSQRSSLFTLILIFLEQVIRAYYPKFTVCQLFNPRNLNLDLDVQ
jgi:hypothetical protein